MSGPIAARRSNRKPRQTLSPAFRCAKWAAMSGHENGTGEKKENRTFSCVTKWLTHLSCINFPSARTMIRATSTHSPLSCRARVGARLGRSLLITNEPALDARRETEFRFSLRAPSAAVVAVPRLRVRPFVRPRRGTGGGRRMAFALSHFFPSRAHKRYHVSTCAYIFRRERTHRVTHMNACRDKSSFPMNDDHFRSSALGRANRIPFFVIY